MLLNGLGDLDWQTVAAALTVAAACWWLLRRVRQTISKAVSMSKENVSGCGHCPRNPGAGKPQDIVPVESIGTKRPPKS